MTYNPATLTTVTLPASRWHTIRTALICFACDQRIKGNDVDADYWLEAYDTLKEAMDEWYKWGAIASLFLYLTPPKIGSTFILARHPHPLSIPWPISIADRSTPWLWCRLGQYWYQFTTPPVTLSPASNLQTRQLVWVRNGAKILSGPAHVWATMGRKGTLWRIVKMHKGTRKGPYPSCRLTESTTPPTPHHA